jgi:rhodanese-related sulfurtransferase
LTKRTALEISIIIIIVLVVGILFNISSPNPLPFIGDERIVDFSQSDSLLIALQKQDSIQKAADSLMGISRQREDSLRIMHIQDSIMTARIQDSTKRVNDSLTAVQKRIEDSLKTIQTTQQEIAKPIDIKLDFAKALFDKNYQFIDARDEADYKAGTVKGAINIPYHALEQHRSRFTSMNKDAVYVVFCSAACDVSIDLAYAMAKEGFKKVYIFHGGWDDWKNAGYPAN